MKSLGFKDGVEWVEIRVTLSELAGRPITARTVGIDEAAVVAYGRTHGVEVLRQGVDDETLDVVWMQGPQIKAAGEEPRG